MRIGIDLGGTKIEGLVLDKGGVERERLRVPTPAGSYEEDVEAILDLIAGLERKVGERCTVGVAHPGAISPATGLVKNANSTRLNGRPLKADLERRLGREVRLANDANCFAVSEASDGAAAGCAIVFGVILGTGVGGGVVIDGRPLTGAQAIAGEWATIPAAARRQRAARPALLLRPHGLHRNAAGAGPPADLPERRLVEAAQFARMKRGEFAAHAVERCEADLQVLAHRALVEGVGGAGQLDLAVQRLVGNAEQGAVGHAQAIALGGQGAASISTAMARDRLMRRRSWLQRSSQLRSS